MSTLRRLRLRLEGPDMALRRFVTAPGGGGGSEYCAEVRNAMAAYMEALLVFASEEHLRVDAAAEISFKDIRNLYGDTLDFTARINDNLRIFLAGNFGLRKILLVIQKNAFVIVALMNCRGLYMNLLHINKDAAMRALVLHLDDLFDGPFSALDDITRNLAGLALVLKNWNCISSSRNMKTKRRSIAFAIQNLIELESTNEKLEELVTEVQECLCEYLDKWSYVKTVHHLVQTVCLITVTVALTCLLWLLFWLGHNFNTRLPSMKRSPSFPDYVKETMVLYAYLGPLVFLFYIELLKALTDSRVIAMNEIQHFLYTTNVLKAAYLKIKRITEMLV